jgi:peroxiredoxin
MKFAKPVLIAVALLAIAGALAYALIDKPDAPASRFTTLEGKSITLDELRGKVVLVNFWATSCPGCIKKMPDMVETYRQYKDRGFEVIAVAMSYDPPAYVANFVQTRQLPFPVVLDTDGAHARAFGKLQPKPEDIRLTPTTFVIDKNGRVILYKLGDFDFVKLQALLDKELS